MWRQALKDAWAGLNASLTLGGVGRRHRVDVVKGKIVSYVERTQRQRPAGALVNHNTLVEVVDADEQAYLEEALDDLVSAGVLDHVVGRFYVLKGRGQAGPLSR